MPEALSYNEAPNMSRALSYYEALNMSRELYGLKPVGFEDPLFKAAELLETVGYGAGLYVGVPLVFKGGKALVWDSPKWLYNNRGNYRGAFNSILTDYKTRCATFKAETNMLRGKHWWQTVNNRSYWTELNKFESKCLETKFDPKYYQELKAKNAGKAEKYFNKYKNQRLKTSCYKEAKAKIADIKAKVKSGKLKGSELRKALSEVDKLIGKGDISVQKLIESGKIKPTSKLGKIGANLKKYSGYNTMNKALTKGAQSSSKVISTGSKAVKGFVKGGGAVTAAIELAIETPEIIETYKTLGAGAGTKQLAKSATVAVASGAGYVAGAWAGGKIGAAVGAGIGTVVPGIGNVVGSIVGGAIGIACGLLGSWLAGKGAKALVGKSELEKAKEKEARNMAKAAIESPEKTQELIAAYEQVINNKDQLVQEGIAETAVQDTTQPKYPQEYMRQNQFFHIV